jgi:uncharacterized membrane protein
MNEETQSHVKNPQTWKRLLFMVLFAIIFNVAELILVVVVVFQFLMALFTGSPHERARDFGAQLGAYLQQLVRFLTYGTDQAPFPFDEWPSSPEVSPAPADDD